MKKVLLVLLCASPLACAVGDITGLSPDTGPAGSNGAAGHPPSGAGGLAVVTGSAGSTGTGGTGGGVGPGSPGAGGNTARADAGVACGTGVIPADVAQVISTRCVACHGNPPLQGVPASLTTYAQLTAPAPGDPTRSVVALALSRMQDAAKPMPPAPLARVTASELGAFQRWVSAGTPAPGCPDGGPVGDAGGGDSGSDGGTLGDPYGTPPVCTSKTTWTRNNSGDQKMNPGLACINCHSTMNKGPTFAVAGTIYPTAHEPDLCNGGAVTTGARVIITGANGQTQTLTPNAAGNFNFQGTIAKPYTARVTYLGRERAMLESQTSGDCNSCHTQTGAMKAPGRIMLP